MNSETLVIYNLKLGITRNMKIITILIKTFLLCYFAITTSIALAVTPLKPWFYTGGDTTPGGTVGVINLAGSLNYTANDFIHMAIEYSNSPAPLTFHWSTLTIDPFGNILPDPITGYDGNIAYVAMAFSPATWDAYSLSYNEFDQPCSDISNLNNWVAPSTNKCQLPRNSATGVSPNIAYSVIYLNTNGSSPLTPDVTKRRFLLMHETGHTFGMDHNVSACQAPPSTSFSVMAADSNPAVCNNVPVTLQPEDDTALTHLLTHKY